MNHTKKRAAKRKSARVGRFKFPYPLTRANRIRNMKAYRERFGSSLSEAMIAVDAFTL